jgi:hypothetical protein
MPIVTILSASGSRALRTNLSFTPHFLHIFRQLNQRCRRLALSRPIPLLTMAFFYTDDMYFPRPAISDYLTDDVGIIRALRLDADKCSPRVQESI